MSVEEAGNERSEVGTALLYIWSLHKPMCDLTGELCTHACMCVSVLCGCVLHNVPTHIPTHVLRTERKAKRNSLEEVSVAHRRGTSLPSEELALFAGLSG